MTRKVITGHAALVNVTNYMDGTDRQITTNELQELYCHAVVGEKELARFKAKILDLLRANGIEPSQSDDEMVRFAGKVRR